MSLGSVMIVAGALLLYALVSGRLQGTVVTAPLVFAAFGFAAGPGGFNVADVAIGHSAIHLIAEATLILVLFTDAARIDLNRVRQDHNLPVRMLAVGLPLVMLLGTIVAVKLFPEFSLWEAALLAALLAPTDAALGQSVVSAKVVPVRIRQAINVESGLNDGIALPAVLLFAALASMHQDATGAAEWLRFVLMQVTLGPLAGALIGYIGAKLLDNAAEKGWMTGAFQGIGILALAVLSYVIAESVGGNGFISAFVGGMVFGHTLKHQCEFLFEFMETEGQLLMLITFLVFGAALLPEGLAHVTPMHFVFAILSLTVIRMVPIAISLIGSKVRLSTQLFLGWFGPRGLASILFVLLILEDTEIAHRHDLLTITVITVALSILLHGVTAAPFASLYGRRAKEMGVCAENQDVAELPLRDGMMSMDESK